MHAILDKTNHTMEYQWHIHQATTEQEALAKELAKELCISEVSASMLVFRGISTAEEARTFIRPTISMLHDPFLMTDMQQAVDRLTEAIENKEKILVYGDYDVDGTTAVSLVYKHLRSFYDNLDFYIPDRYTEGYGISFKGVDYADENGCSLIIALDCGIKSVDKVEYATKRGIDFIICDHHTPGEEIPKAVAVLDPQRIDCTYPYKELSGCGVGFKLMQAYTLQHHLPIANLMPLLELLAMSIASDVVPVTGENRVLASFGLRQIQTYPSVGLSSIMRIAGMEAKKTTFSDLIFKIGPRVNACGRMHSGEDAVRLLITEDAEMAAAMADDVEKNNQNRRDTDKEIFDKALELLQSDADNEQKASTVVCGKDWHKGVIGIVASRLTEVYFRPTIVLTETDGMVSGSARSVGGFDIYSAIDTCSDLLSNFGGHPFAAGLSMPPENLPEFARRFEKYVSEHIQPEQKVPVLKIEKEIALDDITPQFFKVIKAMAPFGPGNPRPVFLTRSLINNRYTKRVGKEGTHLRLDVTDQTAAISGIGFNKGDWAPYLQNGNAVDIVYQLEENTFNHVTSLQMVVEDIKKHG